MKSRFYLHLATLVALASLTLLAPTVSAHSQDLQRTEVALLQAPDTPAQSPQQPAEQQPPSDQNSNRTPDYSSTNRTATTDSPYTDSRFSWGTLIVGLILGGAIGYFIGRNAARPVDVRRDRAA
jgi:hypothetical protein